jgi:FAD/FMN-containing dehydrogenase
MQRTGHNALPLGSLAVTVLVRTAGLGGVQIDADAGTARAGAGSARGAFKAALEPYDAGRYFNYVEESFDITQIFAPEVLERLREVKQRYDPENLFHSNHPVTG